MINRKPYMSPVINIEEFAMQANVAESGNQETTTTHYQGVPKNGNAGNNQECWAKLNEGQVYAYKNLWYVCMPEYPDMTLPS